MYEYAGERANRPFLVPRFVNVEQVRVLVLYHSFSLPEAAVYQFTADKVIAAKLFVPCASLLQPRPAKVHPYFYQFGRCSGADLQP